MHCPRDNSQLKASGLSHNCPQCQGSFLSKESLGKGFFDHIKTLFGRVITRASLTCPGCREKMLKIQYRSGHLRIDICPSCKGVWFDKDEIFQFKSIIARQVKSTKIYTTQGARASDSKLQAQYQKYQEFENQKGAQTTFSEALFQIFTSLPLERNLKPVNPPVVTIALVVLNVLLFLVSIRVGLKDFFSNWAYIPNVTPFFPYGLYSCFLHAGWAHLLGNMYFLWVLGDNVEDVIGKVRFLILYLLAGVMGFWASGIVGPVNIPHIGASGSVAGIIAAYFLLFPKAKFILRFFFIIVFPLSCFAYIGFWILTQFLIMFLGTTNISWAGHLAGFGVGLLAIWWFKRRYSLKSAF